ncbi:hypothetical protein EDB87DRAFT_1574711 [Lactarius vividus]|nr:hypothetical protein EDB87DRAFT_1574711 [Lactarius vividus]
MFIIHIRVLPANPRDAPSLRREALLLADAVDTEFEKGKREKASFLTRMPILQLWARMNCEALPPLGGWYYFEGESGVGLMRPSTERIVYHLSRAQDEEREEPLSRSFACEQGSKEPRAADPVGQEKTIRESRSQRDGGRRPRELLRDGSGRDDGCMMDEEGGSRTAQKTMLRDRVCERKKFWAHEQVTRVKSRISLTTAMKSAPLRGRYVTALCGHVLVGGHANRTRSDMDHLRTPGETLQELELEAVEPKPRSESVQDNLQSIKVRLAAAIWAREKTESKSGIALAPRRNKSRAIQGRHATTRCVGKKTKDTRWGEAEYCKRKYKTAGGSSVTVCQRDSERKLWPGDGRVCGTGRRGLMWERWREEGKPPQGWCYCSGMLRFWWPGGVYNRTRGTQRVGATETGGDC